MNNNDNKLNRKDAKIAKNAIDLFFFASFASLRFNSSFEGEGAG